MASGSGVQYVPGGGPNAVPQWQGVYAGYIAVNVDPLDQGRVKLRIPQVFGGVTSGWASPMVPISYIPKVGTAVNAMFLGGDPARPVWGGNFAVAGGSAGFVFAASAPTSPELGEVWVNTATGLMSEWNGASWIGYQIGGAAIQPAVNLAQPNISGGTITGSRFIADGTSGEFLGYTGTPAAGNMNVSISPVTGTDDEGNAYLDGVAVYSGTGALQLSVNAAVGAPAVGMKTGAASEQGIAALYNWSPTRGAANEYLENYWQGPSSTHDGLSAAIILQSSTANGSATAYGGLVYNGGVIASWDSAGFHVSGTLHGNSGTLTVGDVIQANSDVHVSGKLYGVGGVITVGDTLSAGSWVNMTQGADLVNWTVGSGGAARYRKMPDNTVMVHMTNMLTNGFTGAGTAIWATPYSLTNGATQNFAVTWSVSGTPAALPQQPAVYMSGGDLKIAYLAPNTTGVSFLIRYAID